VAVSLGDHPPFSWSRTRERELGICARRYYWQYYGYWYGWDERRGDEEASLAYRLKKLTGLHRELGSSIHARAHEIAIRVAQGIERPAREELLRRTRSELNGIWLDSRDLEAFRRDPKGHPILRSFYYGERVDSARIERVSTKMRRCLEALHGHEIWDGVAEGELEVVLLEDPHGRPDPAFEIDGVPVYANLDMLLRRVGDGRLVVVDWKTGRPRESDEEQLALYGLFVRQEYGERACRGRLEYLAGPESRSVEIGPERLREAEERARASIREMRGYLADPARNEARSKEAFPLAEDRRACRRCDFFELCEEELRETGGLPWE